MYEHVCMYICNLYVDKMSHTCLTGHENKLMHSNPRSRGQRHKDELRWAMTKLQQFTFSKKIWSLWASLKAVTQFRNHFSRIS